MRWQQQWRSVLVAALLGGLVGGQAVATADEQFLPVLSTREGALRFIQIPIANGYIDYLTLLNERDGGINGVKLVWEECETVFDADRGVACYERLKSKGPTGAAVFHPTGLPLTYALTERATQDQIPLITMGYGRVNTSDGRVFPYVFNPPLNWWSLSTAEIRFIGQRSGGMDRLKGLKIAHVYYEGTAGQESLPMLNAQAAHYGFAIQHLPVKPPGLDQKAAWLRVKGYQPDWVILNSVSIMTPTSLKDAAQAGVPRDRMVGNWRACAEQDVLPAGEAARGYICATYHAAGTHFPLIQDIHKYVYARGKGAGPASDVGTMYWLRGVLQGVLTAEAMRTAMRQFGHQPLTGAQMQWGLEHLNITAADIKEIGAEGLLAPLTLSCRDHEGGGSVQFRQWDGKQWTVISDWIAPDQALVRPLVEASATQYARDNDITPRDCP